MAETLVHTLTVVGQYRLGAGLAAGSSASYDTPGGKSVTIQHLRPVGGTELNFAISPAAVDAADFPSRIVATKQTGGVVEREFGIQANSLRDISGGGNPADTIRQDYDPASGAVGDVFVSGQTIIVQLYYETDDPTPDPDPPSGDPTTEIFSTAGSGTWTVPAGVTSVSVAFADGSGYGVNYWAELVRSSSRTVLSESATGGDIWLRTSDGLPLEQQSNLDNLTSRPAIWNQIASDTDEPDQIISINEIRNIQLRVRFRKSGENWIPDDNGVNFKTIPWNGASTHRFFNNSFNFGSLTANGDLAVSPGDTINYRVGDGSITLTYTAVIDVRLAGLGSTPVGGSSALTKTEPDPVRISGIGSTAAGGSATLTRTEPDPIRITGIGSTVGGGTSALTVAEPDPVRISGVGSTVVGGASQLDTREPAAVRISGRGSTAVGGTSRITLEDRSSVRISGIGATVAGGASQLTTVEPDDVRISGRGSTTVGGTSQLTTVEPNDVRISGRGSTAVSGTSRLIVATPPVRISGIGSTAVGGASELDLDAPDPARIAGLGSTPVGGTSVLVQSRRDVHVPTVHDTRVVSSPVAAADTYGYGELIEVAVTYDQDVAVDTSYGVPALLVSIGGLARSFVYARGSGSAVLVFAYRVRSIDRDADGLFLYGADPQSRGDIDLRRSTIRSELDIAADRRTTGRGTKADHKVDGRLGAPITKRAVPNAVQRMLDSGLVRLATCAAITRQDGAVVRLTDHDADIEVDGETYSSASGFERTVIEQNAGLEIETVELSGSLTPGGVAAVDILAGRYDGARVSVFAVDWGDPAQGIVQLMRGTIGDIDIVLNRYVAEVRGSKSGFSATIGEAYSPDCQADLGDQRCKFPIDPPEVRRDVAYPLGAMVKAAFRPGQTYARFGNAIYECTIAGVTADDPPVYGGAQVFDGAARFTRRDSWMKSATVASVGGDGEIGLVLPAGTNAPDGWFAGGALVWETGANAGRAIEIRSWDEGRSALTPFSRPQRPVSVGDALRLYPGCDKQQGTCRGTFRIAGSALFSAGNIANFRGFPDLVSEDAENRYSVIEVAESDRSRAQPRIAPAALARGYGSAIPRAYGTARLAGSLIWHNLFGATVNHTVNAMGQIVNGGQSPDFPAGFSVNWGGFNNAGVFTDRGRIPTQLADSFMFADFALALCQGPITRVRLVRAGDRVLYNFSDASASNDIDLSDRTVTPFSMREYQGTEEQNVDPTINGVERAVPPSYRGTAYIVVSGLWLGLFGDRIPEFIVEVQV